MTSPSPAIQAVRLPGGLFCAPESESPRTYARRPAERLFRDTILPEKFPETGLFVMKNRVFIEFISTKPDVYLFL